MLAWALWMTLAVGELRWQAPAECPQADDVRARIEAAGGLGDLVVDASVEPTASGWQLNLSIALGDTVDTRILESDTCDPLAESLVALVATRLDAPAPQDSVPAPAPKSAPVPAPKPEPAPKPAPDPDPETKPEPTPSTPALPTGLTLALSAGLSLGSVPTPGLPAELAFGHAWPKLRVSLRGRFHPTPQPLQLDAERSMRVFLGTAGPRVCARPAWRAVEFPLCGEVAVGGNRAVLRGPARTRGGVWLEAGAGAGVAWFFARRWALTGHLAASVPVVGSGYTLDGNEAWAPSAVGGRAMLGVE